MENTVKKPTLQQQLETAVQENSAQIEITATNADVKVGAAVNKELGKGWSATAVANWFKKKGYEVGAMFKWSGK